MQRQPRPTQPFSPFSREALAGTIPDRFEAQHAERLAVKTRKHTLSYRDLNRAANRIAHTLLRRRAQEAEPVALLLEQDAPLITAILGVLKAGHIYLPLDPGYPKAQLSKLLKDAGAACVITDQPNLSLARDLSGNTKEILKLEALDPDTPTTNPTLALSPDAPAYIYYTSGSTGQPKAVVDSHRNVLHNVMRYTNSLHISCSDRLTLLQGCAFSAAVSNVFGALLNGAALFPFDVKREGALGIAPWLEREELTIYHSVPSLFRVVAASNLNLPELRLIRLEGDRATTRDVELYRRNLPESCLLVNGLGATECGLVRQYFIDHSAPVEPTVPLGYATPDMETLILDEEGSALAAGQIGEIAIRSRYLALGYWRRPDLTAAAFTDDPSEAGLRLYRTGDLGRLREDGCLEHLGRKDNRVKVRGYSVELAEVEAALLTCEAVTEAAVCTHELRPGERDLVAYLVARDPPSVKQFRDHLSAILPEQLIPTHFVTLAELPLNENGKVNRRALALPEMDRSRLERPFSAPRSSLEARLAEIWAEVLGLAQVGIFDTFLALGGHSLLATQVVSRVLEQLQIDLDASALLKAATVANMADLIEKEQLRQLPEERLERLLTDLERLSDAEVARLLEDA